MEEDIYHKLIVSAIAPNNALLTDGARPKKSGDEDGVRLWAASLHSFSAFLAASLRSFSAFLASLRLISSFCGTKTLKL